MSGENILAQGNPIVRFEGRQLEYLMEIRRGELPYEAIMMDVEQRMTRLEELKDKTSIPHHVDIEKLDSLYRDLTQNK